MTDKGSRPPPNERPPPEDLKRERDAFIQQFFRKGAQLTEELLKENERLRDKIGDLEQEASRLRALLASDEAIRDLLRKIEKLEQEKRELIHRSTQFEAKTGEFSERSAEVESELANLANLYVAISQLHQAQNVRTVLRNLKELLAQLLGAAAFAVYLASEDHKELVAVASEGVNAAEIARVPATSGPVGDAYTRGVVTFDPRADPSKGTIGKPAAVVPLRLDGHPVGAVAIFSTLPQKTTFEGVDEELFKMLMVQAAPALINARLFTDTGRKMPALSGFLDLED